VIFQGLNAVIVNPSVILGPGDWKSGSSLLFSSVWKGLKFYTRGATGFVDVRDVTLAMTRLMDDEVWENVKNQRYILNVENISFRELFSKIADSLHVKRPKYFANDLWLNLAWRLSAFKSFLTGKQPSITRETARSANRLSYYDGSKICRTIGFKYKPIEASIDHFSRIFLQDLNLK